MAKKSTSENDRQRNARVSGLLMRHRTALYGFIYSCVPHHADAEDLLQEVCLVVTAQFAKLRDDDGFLPWTLEIARRVILAHHRRAKLRPVMPPETVIALAEAALELEKDDFREQHAAALAGCLEKLSPGRRRLIQMRYDGTAPSVAKLAEHVGKTVTATASLLKRIRAALRDCVLHALAREEHL